MTLIFEEVACNLCGSNSFKPYLVRKDLNLFIPGDFRMVRCNQCHLVYLNPRPTRESFTSIYLDSYDQYQTEPKTNEPRIRKFIRNYGFYKQAKSILHFKRSGQILDIGCSTGDFLDIMRQYPNWSAVGIEPSSFASEYARSRRVLQVKTGYLDVSDFDDNTFDVVTLWNVLEHLSDPSETLNTIHRILKSDGLLVITTPNLDSLDARLFGDYWVGYELPRHFYVFSTQTLSMLLEKTGFSRLNRRTVYGSHAAAMTSIRFWLQSKTISDKLRKRLSSFLFSNYCRIVTAPYFYLSDRMNLSSGPTDFCVKVKNS
jgi:2-polyprenyl-3-methyl-5-hydroxy-6-metoxy-1,4-benzoquinol methylase